MSIISAPTSIIVETKRGPSIAGTRITVYAIIDYLKSGLSFDAIKENFDLSDEQLNGVLKYIEEHHAEVEMDYAEIARRSDERRAHYERVYRARSPFAPELSTAERAVLMRRNLANPRAEIQHNDDHDTGRPQSRGSR